MRDIKFRAWIIDNKTMVDAKELAFDDCGLGCAKGKQYLYEVGYRNKPTEYVHSPKFILMQFTGAKDSEYNELYECDIISDNVGIGHIEYCEKYAGFRINYGNGQCKWFYAFTDGELKSLMRIGNAYENKDLEFGFFDER